MAFITMRAVTELLNVPRSTIYRWVESDEFPSPYAFGPRCVRFQREEILTWIAERRGKKGQAPPIKRAAESSV